MSRPAPNSTEYIEKVALEHCRWYFGQDVRIITLRKALPLQRNNQSSGGQQFVAIVFPVPYSLMFLQELEDEMILMQVRVSDSDGGQPASRDLVLQKLLDVVQLKIGNSLTLGDD